MLSQLSFPSGPGEIVDKLHRWAIETAWVEWLELAGSLGRGAGDQHSDVDAGIGVTDTTKLDAVQASVSSFAPVSASMRQSFGPDATHMVTVYLDGRQLSLVVMPNTARSGLAPQALALVDKADRLAVRMDASHWAPGIDQCREWTFLACIGASDAVKHASRGNGWRAVRSLHEARDYYLQLLAARESVTFPQFGAVSLENAGLPVPVGLNRTLVARPQPPDVTEAVSALVELLDPFIREHELDGLAHSLGLTRR